MPRSSRLETHDHSTCGFMAWCRKSGAQVAGKLENSTAIVAADGEKSARIDLKVLPAFDKCPNEGKDEQLRSLLQHSFDELKLRYDGHVARFDCQQRRPSPYLVSQEEKPSKSARGAGPPGTRKARRDSHQTLKSQTSEASSDR